MGSQIDETQELAGREFLLDGYLTLGRPREITIGGRTYVLQCFQGEHEDEYTLREDNKVCLFHNGVMKMAWEEDMNGSPIADFTRFENGRVAFIQSFDDIYDGYNFYRIVNNAQGERMEIYSHKSGKLIYHGEFNEKRERNGWGIEYDRSSGRMLFEGIWKKNRLSEILRKIEGNIMTEFKENGDNTIASNRIPIYVGEFVYDEEKESFIRNGRGYWIDEETRIATREVEWKDGVEVSGRDLYDGWYTRSTKPKAMPVSIPAPKPAAPVAPITINVTSSIKLSDVNYQVTDLVIASNCCNDLNTLDLARFQSLQTIEIGSDCFGSAQTFTIDGLNRLKTIKIGSNSFTQVKQAEWDPLSYSEAVNRCIQSKSFNILNCELLESIEIGEYSFVDFAGDFELKNLPQLQSVQIGSVGNRSWNFFCCSFVIGGIDRI